MGTLHPPRRDRSLDAMDGSMFTGSSMTSGSRRTSIDSATDSALDTLQRKNKKRAPNPPGGADPDVHAVIVGGTVNVSSSPRISTTSEPLEEHEVYLSAGIPAPPPPPPVPPLPPLVSAPREPAVDYEPTATTSTAKQQPQPYSYLGKKIGSQKNEAGKSPPPRRNFTITPRAKPLPEPEGSQLVYDPSTRTTVQHKEETTWDLMKFEIAKKAFEREKRGHVIKDPERNKYEAGISLDDAIQAELRLAAKQRTRRRSQFVLRMREGTMSKLYKARPQPEVVEPIIDNEVSSPDDEDSEDASSDSLEMVDWVPADDLDDDFLKDDPLSPHTSRGSDMTTNFHISNDIHFDAKEPEEGHNKIKKSVERVLGNLSRTLGRRNKVKNLMNEGWEVYRSPQNENIDVLDIKAARLEKRSAYAYHPLQDKLMFIPNYDRVVVTEDGQRIPENKVPKDQLANLPSEQIEDLGVRNKWLDVERRKSVFAELEFEAVRQSNKRHHSEGDIHTLTRRYRKNDSLPCQPSGHAYKSFLKRHSQHQRESQASGKNEQSESSDEEYPPETTTSDEKDPEESVASLSPNNNTAATPQPSQQMPYPYAMPMFYPGSSVPTMVPVYPGMQMPGMQMPGMQMPGMQMPGMQMPGMQMAPMPMAPMPMPGMAPGMPMPGYPGYPYPGYPYPMPGWPGSTFTGTNGTTSIDVTATNPAPANTTTKAIHVNTSAQSSVPYQHIPAAQPMLQVFTPPTQSLAAPVLQPPPPIPEPVTSPKPEGVPYPFTFGVPATKVTFADTSSAVKPVKDTDIPPPLPSNPPPSSVASAVASEKDTFSVNSGTGLGSLNPSQSPIFLRLMAATAKETVTLPATSEQPLPSPPSYNELSSLAMPVPSSSPGVTLPPLSDPSSPPSPPLPTSSPDSAAAYPSPSLPDSVPSPSSPDSSPPPLPSSPPPLSSSPPPDPLPSSAPHSPEIRRGPLPWKPSKSDENNNKNAAPVGFRPVRFNPSFKKPLTIAPSTASTPINIY